MGKNYLEVLLLILPLVCKIDGQYQHQSQNQYSHQNRPGPNYQYQQQPNYTPTRSGDEQSAEWTTRAPATGRPGTTTKRWSHQNFTIDKRFDQLDSVKKFLKYDQEVSHEIEQFSLKLFSHFLLNPDLGVDNFMISPFSIYHILTMILEGSGGSTYQELKSFLHSSDSFKTRDFLQYLNFKLKSLNTDQILKRFAMLIYDVNRPIKNEYNDLMETTYEALTEPVAFRDIDGTVDRVNSLVSDATNGHITEVVNRDDLLKAQLIMISGLHFKGNWKSPFNLTDTKEEKFYDIDGKHIGNVEMMFQRNPIAFSTLKEIGSYVLEMEYADPPPPKAAGGTATRFEGEFGKGLSMILVLPKKGQTLAKTAQDIYQFSMDKIYRSLYESKVNYGDEEVEVSLPKFDITTDADIKYLLQQMGLTEIFDQSTANLEKINKNNYISAMVHKAKISVDELGTTASAVTSAIFANKSTPPKFNANRPFLYFIVEKYTNLILFAGQYVGPPTNRN